MAFQQLTAPGHPPKKGAVLLEKWRPQVLKSIVGWIYPWLVRSRAGLRALDAVRATAEYLKTMRSNYVFRVANPDYPVPPRGLMFDAHRHMSYPLYRQSGEEHAKFYAGLFAKHYNLRSGTRILEWGCGPARIIRHLSPNLVGQQISLYGSDYNPATIEWCRAHIHDVQFAINGLNPPLPYESGFFNIVYCRSVFTHLALENAAVWMSELRRITKPGGLISLSTQGDASFQRLTAPEKMRYSEGKPVLRDVEIEGKKYFSAFHPPQYVRDHLIPPGLGVEELLSSGQGGNQDVWVIRNL